MRDWLPERIDQSDAVYWDRMKLNGISIKNRSPFSKTEPAIFAQSGQAEVAPTGTQSVADGPQPTHSLPTRKGPRTVCSFTIWFEF